MDAFLGLNGTGNATPICMLPGLSIRLPGMINPIQRGIVKSFTL
jgi:hypothetical protein